MPPACVLLGRQAQRAAPARPNSLQQAPDCSVLRTEPETSPPPQCLQGGLPPPSHTWGRRLTCPELGVLSPTVSTTCFPWHLAHSVESTAYHEWCLQPEIKPRVAAKQSPRPPGSPLHTQARVHWQHPFPLTAAVTREAVAETHLLTACPALALALLSKETNPRHPYRSISHRALPHPQTPPQHSWPLLLKHGPGAKPPKGRSECPRCWATSGPWNEHKGLNWPHKQNIPAPQAPSHVPRPQWEESGNNHLRKPKTLSTPSFSLLLSDPAATTALCRNWTQHPAQSHSANSTWPPGQRPQ